MISVDELATESKLIDEKLKNELSQVFEKLESEILLKAVVDIQEEKGHELAVFLKVIASLHKNISLQLFAKEEADMVSELDQKYLPVVGMYQQDCYSGIEFHGVPGGQEINSFVLAMYHLAGPVFEISRGLVKKIQQIDQKVNIKICVSLACHHCPKVVVACQKMSVLNHNIVSEMIDATLYQGLVEQYAIERVPVVIINDKEVYVGTKSIEEMVEIVKKTT
ncbi:MAG: thioredoxin family protein [Lachnospiraceae bacterium]